VFLRLSSMDAGSLAQAELLDAYDYVWERLLRRLDGLSDEEYLWEPVAGCLTVRATPSGVVPDPGVWPDVQPAPFTTVAWRLCHIADNFTEDRIAPLLGSSTPPRSPTLWPMTAGAAVDYVEAGYLSWRANLASAEPNSLWRTLDDDSTPYRGRSLFRFLLQYLEEFAHHAAEVALLRDLYRS